MAIEIFVTGSSGFVGSYLRESFRGTFFLKCYERHSNVKIDSQVVLHLAGLAHDLKKTKNVKDYYTVNTELTKRIFDDFMSSNAETFVFLSSVKAAADSVEGILYEDLTPNPKTHYGKSKLYAENYILSKEALNNKRIYILRPCMIHGPNNKGNLNLLYKLVSKRIPWILGLFNNSRSYCSLENLSFIIRELITNKEIPSGVYNVSDDDPIDTNDIIRLISNVQNKKAIIWNIPKCLIKCIAKIGDVLPLPLNSERLNKLTETYVVSNKKLVDAIGKKLPVNSKKGMLFTLNSFGEI
jgi:nucleoside-diphosphate-sugar epimerase